MPEPSAAGLLATACRQFRLGSIESGPWQPGCIQVGGGRHDVPALHTGRPCGFSGSQRHGRVLPQEGQSHTALLRFPSEPVGAAEACNRGNPTAHGVGRGADGVGSHLAFCLESLETERTSWDRLGASGAGSGPDACVRTWGWQLLTELQPAVIRYRRYGTGAPANPGHQVDGRACFRRARGRLVRPFSGYRLSRWSTVDAHLTGQFAATMRANPLPGKAADRVRQAYRTALWSDPRVLRSSASIFMLGKSFLKPT